MRIFLADSSGQAMMMTTWMVEHILWQECSEMRGVWENLGEFTVFGFVGGGNSKYLLFSPTNLGKESNLTLTNVFQMGGSTTN